MDVLAYNEEINYLGDPGYHECFSFDGITWKALPSLLGNHCAYPYGIRSHYTDLGWWVGAMSENCNLGLYGNFSSELLTLDNDWIELPDGSPFGEYYPFGICTLPLNSTHIFFSGGYVFDTTDNYLNTTWALNLENLEWTAWPPMLSSRDGHGCLVTADNEVMIAGRWNGDDLDVQIFNPVSMEWRREGELPPGIGRYKPILLLWEQTPILLESFTQNIWQRDSTDLSWHLLNRTMGADFEGAFMKAIIVSEELYQCI